MTIYQSKQELLNSMDEAIRVEDGTVSIEDEANLQGPLMDELVYNAVFADDDVRALAGWLI